MNEIKKDYIDKRIFLLKDAGTISDIDLLIKFVKKNRNKVEK
jgi:hypothetical protein